MFKVTKSKIDPGEAVIPLRVPVREVVHEKLQEVKKERSRMKVVSQSKPFKIRKNLVCLLERHTQRNSNNFTHPKT